MKQFSIIAGVAIFAALALWHPAPGPPSSTFETASHAGLVLPPTTRHSWAQSQLAQTLVYVAGAVRRPGLYRVAAQARVDDAVRRAGGLAADADADGINLAERVNDGEEIRVPRTGEAPAHTSHRRRSRKHRHPAAVVDLNNADVEALAALPGVGSTLAQRIVDYRAINGPFVSVDELGDVAGITARHLDSISSFLTVHEAH